jgi:hypothetical protein
LKIGQAEAPLMVENILYCWRVLFCCSGRGRGEYMKAETTTRVAIVLAVMSLVLIGSGVYAKFAG